MLPELYDDDVQIEEEELEHAPQDELAVRRLMIRTYQLERDKTRVEKTKRAVVASYDEKLQRIEAEAARIRSSIAAYVERHGTVKFADVGTAYLQNGNPKIEIEDAEAFKAGLGSMFVKEVFDETAAKQYALEQATGETGEIVDGATLVPGGPQLRIRKS